MNEQRPVSGVADVDVCDCCGKECLLGIVVDGEKYDPPSHDSSGWDTVGGPGHYKWSGKKLCYVCFEREHVADELERVTAIPGASRVTIYPVRTCHVCEGAGCSLSVSELLLRLREGDSICQGGKYYGEEEQGLALPVRPLLESAYCHWRVIRADRLAALVVSTSKYELRLVRPTHPSDTGHDDEERILLVAPTAAFPHPTVFLESGLARRSRDYVQRNYGADVAARMPEDDDEVAETTLRVPTEILQ